MIKVEKVKKGILLLISRSVVKKEILRRISDKVEMEKRKWNWL